MLSNNIKQYSINMYILNIIISNISMIYARDYRFYRDAPVQNFEYIKPRSEFTKIKKSTD